MRLHLDLIESLALHLPTLLDARKEEGYSHCFEALDRSAMPVRDIKRRGEGWLAGYADIGWSNRLGWFEGFRLLVAADPMGAITGFSASAPRAPRISRWLRPSSPCATGPIPGCQA